MRPLWSRRGEKTVAGTFRVGKDRQQDPLQKVKLKSWTVLYSSLSLFLRQVPASHSHLFPPVTEVPRPSCLGLSEVLLFRTTIKFCLLKHDRLEKKKKKHQEPEKPVSSPWPPLELSFQLNDNRFCLRNCYVIWCMGVIWLRTRDGSTSHKILPEFSDLCVLLLLLCATWPIYLLQKYKVKDKPGKLKSNWKPS